MSDVTVYQALTNVLADVGAIPKNRSVDKRMGGYSFRGIDDLYDALHGPLAKHGVLIVPEVLDRDDETYTTSGGTDMRLCKLLVRYRFYGPAGDHIEAVTVGEAADAGDKAANKAMTAALKYLLFQVLCIPVEGNEDADASSPQLTDTQDWHTSLRELLSKVPWPDELDDETQDLYQAAGIARFTKDKVNTIAGLSDEQAQYIAGKLRTSKQREKFVDYATEWVEGSEGDGSGPQGSGEGPSPSDTPPEPSVGDRLFNDVRALWRAQKVNGDRVLGHARAFVGKQDDLDEAEGRIRWESWKDLGADTHPDVLRELASWLEDMQAKAGAA